MPAAFAETLVDALAADNATDEQLQGLFRDFLKARKDQRTYEHQAAECVDDAAVTAGMRQAKEHIREQLARRGK